MKKIKLIRIDEVPRKFPQSTLKILTDLTDEKRTFRRDDEFSRPFSSGQTFSFRRDYSSRNSSPLGSAQHMHHEENMNTVEMPPHIVNQLIRTNDLIVSFSAELEQDKKSIDYIQEFQHDSFRIGLKVTEGIFLHNLQPHLAGRQFDLVIIHIENTLITLDNFESEKIGSSLRIKALKKACTELIPMISELKEYLGLK